MTCLEAPIKGAVVKYYGAFLYLLKTYTTTNMDLTILLAIAGTGTTVLSFMCKIFISINQKLKLIAETTCEVDRLKSGQHVLKRQIDYNRFYFARKFEDYNPHDVNLPIDRH